MIKFFRKIRQNLIMENKSGKYIKYAIGEIFLVMIGILLALQVNNWNEGRKLKQTEISLLKELRSDLLFSKNEMDIILAGNSRQVKLYKKINSYIEKDLPYNNELDSAFVEIDKWSAPYIPTITYENLKNIGIDIIQNDSLKRQIVKAYELDFKLLLVEQGKWEWSFSQNTTQRIMNENIRQSIEFELATPNDFEKLKKDPIFMNFLSTLILIRDSHVNTAQETKKSITSLLEHINQELESRQ